jgi:hypothetical protein
MPDNLRAQDQGECGRPPEWHGFANGSVSAYHLSESVVASADQQLRQTLSSHYRFRFFTVERSFNGAARFCLNTNDHPAFAIFFHHLTEATINTLLIGQSRVLGVKEVALRCSDRVA